MARRILFALLILTPLLLWAGYAMPPAGAGFWAWRRAVLLLGGVLALWWMSAAILCALRLPWLERAAGGLDRLYRRHRDLGIGAGLLVFAHWMAEWAPKQLARLGLLPPRPRGAKGEEGWWVDFAEDLGEWAGYLVLALVVIALLRRIPYRAFRGVHRAFALLFLAGAVHGLLLMPAAWWGQPLGVATALLAVAGAGAALVSLRGRIGWRRRHPARIEALAPGSDGVLVVTLRPDASWPGHRAGQFLLADFGHRGEGAHPFTIASAWSPGGTLTLAIKALGDYTRSLPGRLAVGQRVVLEGPYGAFDFTAGGEARPQVWVAGGIGITPFIARLQALRARGARTDTVDLFYSVRSADADAYPPELETLCQATGVRLHRWTSDTAGPLPSESIGRCLPAGGSVWFCGPAAWGEALENWLTAAGLPRRRFHRECFVFR